MKLPFLRLPGAAGPDPLPLPTRATADAAGLDVRAAVRAPIDIGPGQRALVPTGFAMALPSGYEAQVRPRSGLAYRHGLTVLNAPGTIDADYRGELKVLLINLGDAAVRIERGHRIAQLVIAPVTQAEPVITETLDSTDRGADGFGSTGTG